MISTEKSVVNAFIEAINKHALSEMSALMSEEHTFIDSSGRAASGRDLMTTGWEQYFNIFPDFNIQVQNILGDKNLVAVFGSTSGTYKGKRGLVPENRIEMPAAWRAVIEDGKVKVWQVYADWTEGTRIINEDKK